MARQPLEWLLALRVYFGVVLAGNVIWEVLHLPLYAIWRTGTLREQAFAPGHCTLGDLLIAMSALMLALLLAGDQRWPRERSVVSLDDALWPSLLGLSRVIQPGTILRWHRAGFRAYWRWKSRGRSGRPRVCRELRELIRRMSKENPLWGAPRIHGELLKLGFEITESTVSNT
jgi:hypothetical protein